MIWNNCFGFLRKVFIMPKTYAPCNLGLKIGIFEVSQNLFIRFFWTCTWWHALKNRQMWEFWGFKENFCFKLGKWDLKSFLKLYMMTDIKNWVKVSFGFLRKIHIMPKTWEMTHFWLQNNIFRPFTKSFQFFFEIVQDDRHWIKFFGNCTCW